MSHRVGNPEDRFSCVAAYFMVKSIHKVVGCKIYLFGNNLRVIHGKLFPDRHLLPIAAY